MPVSGEARSVSEAWIACASDGGVGELAGSEDQRSNGSCAEAQSFSAAEGRGGSHRENLAVVTRRSMVSDGGGPALPYDSEVHTTVHRRREGGAVAQQIPMVDYLVLGDSPHLVANECTDCGAKFFDRRNACASCGGTSFKKTDIATEGEIRSFTIVTAFMPGADNYVPVVVDLGGTSVRGQLINAPAEAANIALGQKVRLTTYSIGADTAGTEAINYGFEPVN